LSSSLQIYHLGS